MLLGSIDEHIAQFGGKMAHQLHGFYASDVPVFPFVHWQSGESFRIAEIGFNFLLRTSPSGKIIVRGSHPNDHHGYIDVLPTSRDITSVSELEDAVKEIERVAASDEVRAHAHDWGQPYSPEVTVMIQHQSPSSIVGSMFRHPHVRDTIFIEYVDANGRVDMSGRRMNSSSRAFNGKVSSVKHIDYEGIGETEIQKLVEMYEQLEVSSFFDPAWSYQVEFGLNPLKFYQARPFKKFEPAAEWKATNAAFEYMPHILVEKENVVLGITPEEGVKINFKMSRYGHINMEPEDTDAYGLIQCNKLYQSSPISDRWGNLEVVVSPLENHNFQTHPFYRFAKRAKYALVAGITGYKNLNEGKRKYQFDPNAFDELKRGLLYSNGRSAVIMPLSF